MSKGFKSTQPPIWASRVVGVTYESLPLVEFHFKTVSGKPNRSFVISYPIDSARTFAESILEAIKSLEPPK